jgi:hypothetical protein
MAQYRLYASAPTMPTASANDFAAITVGLQFTVNTQVRLLAILWWQATTGTSLNDRTVGLWSTTDGVTGSLIGSIKTQVVAGAGWQTVTLDSPVTLVPGTYIAAVHHPFGQYTAVGGYYMPGGGGYGDGINLGITTNEIFVPNKDNALNEKQNAYIYAPYFSFPDEQFNGGMYGVDILVDNAPAPPAPDLHVYDGATWRGGHLHVYDGSQWISGELDS